VTKIKVLHKKWMKNPTYRAEYETFREELGLAQTLIEARSHAGLSQVQVARRMKTPQSYVARLESGQVKPSTDALERFAQATGFRLKILFEPLNAR